MSYSPSEHLDHVDGSMVFARALYAEYPDARYGTDGRWFSARVPISECQIVQLEVVPGQPPGGRHGVYILCGKPFAGGVIWSDEGRFRHIVPTYLSPDAKREDDLRRALLEWAAK